MLYVTSVWGWMRFFWDMNMAAHKAAAEKKRLEAMAK